MFKKTNSWESLAFSQESRTCYKLSFIEYLPSLLIYNDGSTLPQLGTSLSYFYNN